MNRCLAMCLAAVVWNAPAGAAEPVLYPAKNAVIALTFPQGWEVSDKDGVLSANPADEEDFFVEMAAMAATPDDGAAVIQEAKASLAESYRKLKYDEVQKARLDDVGVLNAMGEDDDGKVNLNAVLVVNEAQNRVVMLLRVASPAAAPKHATALTALINSIRAVKAAAPQGLSFTPKVRKMSFASEVLFKDLTQGEGGVGTADVFYFRDAKVRKVTGIEVKVPYDNKETGVELWTVQHDDGKSCTYTVKLIPDGKGGTTWSLSKQE